MLQLILALLTAACGAFAGTAELGAAAESGKRASYAASLPDAHEFAGRGFDNSGRRAVFSPPLVRIPTEERRPIEADLVVGEPGKHQLREPRTPLSEDGKAKEQTGSMKLWWTLGGVAAGAGIGFLLGGPIGAAIGGVLGGLLGFFLA